MLAAGFLIAFDIQYYFFPGPDDVQYTIDSARACCSRGSWWSRP